jgi:hypothetical protein
MNKSRAIRPALSCPLGGRSAVRFMFRSFMPTAAAIGILFANDFRGFDLFAKKMHFLRKNLEPIMSPRILSMQAQIPLI